MNKSPPNFQSYNKVTKIFLQNNAIRLTLLQQTCFQLGAWRNTQVSISLKAPFIGFQIKWTFHAVKKESGLLTRNSLFSFYQAKHFKKNSLTCFFFLKLRNKISPSCLPLFKMKQTNKLYTHIIPFVSFHQSIWTISLLRQIYFLAPRNQHI